MPRITTQEKNAAFLLKAEVVCNELIQADISMDKIRYIANGSFKRSFRMDIDSITETPNGEVEVAVNRDGIYDKLPEGLFHQTRAYSGSTVSDMVAEHKRYKAEEKSARRFFRPLEQEFFRYSLMVEQEERRLTHGMYDDHMLQLFREFWDLDENLPFDKMGMLVRIMPWAATLKGNLQLTAKTLELVLQKPVIAEEVVFMQSIPSEEKLSLGYGILGMDTVSGTTLEISTVSWKFTISDLAEKEVEFYTENKPHGRLLKRFTELFVPVEIDAIFEYESLQEKNNETESILGYSFTL
ncbi:MAG TPA: hypothetical protein VL098_03900 [Flavipsychrobacter sp.]|nr:hypothetical protein [Flavipsychrobacter sp.]